MPERQGARDVTPGSGERSAGVRATEAATRVAATARRVGAEPVLRAAEPVPRELQLFLTQTLAAARPGDVDAAPRASVTPLGALLTPGEPWPVDLAILLLRRIAALLDAADAAGMVLGTFSPGCVALYGAHLVLVGQDARAGVDPVYVAPEQLQPGALVDARAGQYGLAYVAFGLLAGAPRVEGGFDALRILRHARTGHDPLPAVAAHAALGEPVRHVLRVARDPDRDHRFRTAGQFVTALDAACAEWVRPTDAGARWPAHTAGATATSRTLVRAGGVVAVAMLVGVGVGWYVARRPAVIPPELVNDSAIGRVLARAELGPAPASAGISAVRAPDHGAPAATDAAEPRTAARVVAVNTSQPRTPRPARGDTTDTRRARVPPVPAVPNRLGAFAASVVVPGTNADRDDVRRRIANATDFAAHGIGGPVRHDIETPEPSAPNRSDVRGSAETSVTMAARVPGSDGPRYPAVLLADRLEGEVVARFVVDSTGHVNPGTFELVRSSHPFFADAVRESLRRLRYLPAERGTRHVQQVVEQTFRFAPPD